MQSWSEYFELTHNRPPNPLLETTVNLVVNRETALDLGAGSLKDSKFLLQTGFQKVTAVEQDPAARKYRAKIPAHRLTLKINYFENLKLKPRTFNLVTAQFALSFTSPPHLPGVMAQIIDSLQPAGIFCAQFFGPKDGWNTPENNFTFITSRTLKKWLKPLDIIHFREEQTDSATIDGEQKHWHIFHVIALKPPLK